MAMFESENSELASLSQRFQRDINCLSDPSRILRRKSLEKLYQYFKNYESVSDSAEMFFFKQLFNTFLNLLSDPVEKCRELSIEFLSLFSTKFISDGSKLLQGIVPILNQRIGILPFKETAEELRLMYFELLAILLPKSSPTIVSQLFDQFSNIFCKALTDQFPDVKRSCSNCLVLVCTLVPNDIGHHMSDLVTPLVVNLGHQHTKIRLCTLQALGLVISCGSESLHELMKEKIVPSLRKLLFDRNVAIRKEFVIVLDHWFRHLNQIKSHLVSLFPMLVAGLSDPAVEVQEMTLATIENLGENVLETLVPKEESYIETQGSSVDPILCNYPKPFKTRPCNGLRTMTQHLLKDILAVLLPEMEDWTVQTRCRATSTLESLIALAEDAINPYLDIIFGALSHTCRDDEREVAQAVQNCVVTIGKYADVELIFSILLPQATGEVAHLDSSSNRTNVLVLLSTSIVGMDSIKLLSHLEALTKAIINKGLRETEDPSLQDQLAITGSNILTSAGTTLKHNKDYGLRLFWLFNQLLSAATPETRELASKSIVLLANCLECQVEELYSMYMPDLLSTIYSRENEETPIRWSKASPKRQLFDVLCRHCHQGVRENIDLIVEIILSQLSSSNDADVRLAFLALLETLLGTELVAKSFGCHITRILIEGIMPNIVWNAGKVASVIRKVAMACTYTLLRHGLADKSCLFDTAPKILPVLKCCLDDGDANTRQLVCLSLQHLFVALPGALGEQPITEMYPEMLKRLDDSNDTVRIAICSTFITFFTAAPKNLLRGTILDYSLDCLFVHLDDLDLSIQEAVFNVIKEAVDIDSGSVLKKSTEARTRHRSPHYCDQLIQLCRNSSTP